MAQSTQKNRDNQSSNSKLVYAILALVLVLIASGFARGWASYDEVFLDDGQVRLLGVDPYFHLRQSQQILNDFPVIERHDNRTHYPTGTKNDASGLFNMTVAATTLVIYGSDASIDELAAISAWLAFILGTLSTVLLFLLTLKLLGPVPAVLSIVLFSLFPGSFLDRSILGFADQHIAEIFLALAITYALVWLLEHAFSSKKRTIALSAIAAIPFVLLVYTWRGALLYLPIIAVCLLVYITLVMQTHKELRPTIVAIGGFAATTFLVFLLVHLAFPWLELSKQGTQWLTFGVAALTCCLVLYVGLLQKSPVEKRPQYALIGSAVISVIVILALLYTPIGQKIGNVLFEQRSTMVREHKDVDLTHFLYQLGLSGILALAGAIAGLFLIFKQRLLFSVAIPIVMGAAWLLLWWQTGDFGYLVSPFAAFMATLFIVWLLPKRLELASLATVAVALVLLIGPLQLSRKPWLDSAQAQTLKIYPEGWYAATKWLKQHAPKDDQNSYGVISAWDFGNIIASHANKAPTWSRYPSRSNHRWLTAQTEEDAQKWLCPQCQQGQSVRYAFVDAASFGPFFAAKAQMANMPLALSKQTALKVKQKVIPKMTFNHVYASSMVSKLYAKDGIGLSNYRLVYESPQNHFVTAHLAMNNDKYDFKLLALPIEDEKASRQYQQFASSDVVIADTGYLYDGGIYPSVKIFEIVPGAIIGGKATEGTQLQARLDLQVISSGRQFTYTQTVSANNQGRYIMTVPYPTGSEQGTTEVKALSPYQLFVKAPGELKFKLHGEFNVSLGKIYR